MIKKRTGFVLVETLIVSVFMMTLLALLYSNTFPVVAEYERRRYYDSVSSKYAAHWARKMILNMGQPEIFTFTNGYLDVTDCSFYTNVAFCENFKSINHIKKIYLTEYNFDTFKNYIQNDSRFTRELKDYLDVLSKNIRSQPGVYRVILEIRNPDIDEANSYGTIEVRR